MIKVFLSPTYGRLSFDEMFERIKRFIEAEPDAEYRIMIGTDSQNFRYTKFVTAIVVHRVGKGAIYFRGEQREKRITNLHQKIAFETTFSLEIAQALAEKFSAEGISKPIAIHADIGLNGPTSKYISEITGWVRASGFSCRTKPQALAASSVANKYSKCAVCGE